MYMKIGLNKFFASLLGTEKFLGGSTRSLAYTNHIIQFGLNKFLVSLSGTEKFLGGSTRSLAYTEHIIQFGLNTNPGYKNPCMWLPPSMIWLRGYQYCVNDRPLIGRGRGQ